MSAASAMASYLHSALINLLNRKHRQLFGNCCLCLKTVEPSAIRIQDEIIVKGSLSPQSLFEILVSLLGEEIGSSLSLDDPLCDLCRLKAVNSYNFIKTCRDTIERLSSTVNSLADGLMGSTGDLAGCKSLFVTLNTSDCTTNLYYDKNKPAMYRFKLIQRLHSLIDRKQNQQQKLIFEYDNDYGTGPNNFETDIETVYMTDPCTKLEKFKINLLQDIENTIETDKATNQRTNANILRRKPKNEARVTTISTTEMMYGKDDLRCKICLQQFVVTRNLRQHYFRVHAPKEFKCLECKRSYGSKPILAEHMLISHTPSVCSICGKEYSKRSSLKQHEAAHKFQVICPKCGKCYKTSLSLKTHSCQQNRNMLEKKNACNHCDKKFVRKSTLRTHIKFEHGNGTAHVCTWCNKKFAALSTLKLHIVTHTQEKKFSCEICGGKFVSKASLVYHTRTHTGDKPYECEVCHMMFLSASRRSAHAKHAHSSPNLECDKCNSKFKTRSGLVRHQKIHSKPEQQADLSKS